MTGRTSSFKPCAARSMNVIDCLSLIQNVRFVEASSWNNFGFERWKKLREIRENKKLKVPKNIKWSSTVNVFSHFSKMKIVCSGRFLLRYWQIAINQTGFGWKQCILSAAEFLKSYNAKLNRVMEKHKIMKSKKVLFLEHLVRIFYPSEFCVQ